MEDLEDSEIQFSEWTDSLDDELMATEDRTIQDNIQTITNPPFQSDHGRSSNTRDSSKLHGITSACFPLDCDGKIFHIKDKCILTGYLSTGVIDRISHCRQDVAFTECTMQLFGSKFATGSALVCEAETLFYLLRQEIFKIENMQSEEGVLPLSYEMNAKCIEIRKECVQFMSYLHDYINSGLLTPFTSSNITDNQYIQTIYAMPDIITQQLEALVVFLGRLTDLPIASLIRTDTLYSAARPSALFYLVHVYLEMVWNVIQALWEILVSKDKGNHHHSSGVDDIIASINNITLALLWDLTALSAACYNKVSRTDTHKSSPFTCACVCEVWVLLIHTLDHLSTEYDIEPFWSSLSCILQQVLSPDETSDSDETPSQVRSNFVCNDPIGFCWWLLSQVAPLYWVNERGAYLPRTKGSTAGNWVFMVDLLKSSLGELQDGHQEMHRRFYLKCCTAVSRHWSANTSLVLWLWDYFHKRMNELFNIPSHTIHGLTTASLTATRWMEQCLDRSHDNPTSFDQENSFSLLLRIIAIHLNKLLQAGSQQGWKQMKGRFYSKFHKRRMEELDETGLKNFLSLFLTLSCLADLEDVATKMCYFLDLLDFATEHPGKKVVMMKGLFSLMLVYKQRKVDFAYLSNKMSTMFASIAKEYYETQNRDKTYHRHLWDLVVVYLDSTLEIFEHKHKQDLSESKLLASEGFRWLFSCCRDNELRHVLTFVQSVIVLARPSSRDRINDNNQDVPGFLWKSMFPHLQKLSRDRTIMTSLSINLADTMAGFTLLALEKYPVAIAEAGNVSFVDLVREYGIEDDIPASFACRFLCHVITAPGAVSVLQTESLQGHVIHTWFRCLLQLPPTHDNCAAFSRAVAKLSEMESLTKTQAGFGLSDSSENTLKQFIMSVGNYHSTLTKFDEVIQFRERAQLYFGDVAKYVDPFVSSGKPQDSLRLAFSVSGLLFKHCYKTIYSKTQPHCLLPRLLDQLIVPLNYKKTIPPPVQQCVKASLHWFLQGLSCLDFKRDDFIKRKIRQIFGKYFHPLSQKTQVVSVKNPFIVALKDSMEREPSQDASDFRQFAIELIADTFLQLPQPPQNLTSTLYFINQLFKRTLSPKEIARNTVCMLIPVLGCLLACNASPPANEPPDIRRQATDILRMMIESCKETQDKNYRDVLLPLMKTFVFNNLQQFKGLVFKTFDPLTVLDPDLVADIIPVLKQSVMQSEQKRGVGSDSQLRGALQDLLQRIGRSHEADNTSY